MLAINTISEGHLTALRQVRDEEGAIDNFNRLQEETRHAAEIMRREEDQERQAAE